MQETAYVVESPAIINGERVGTYKVYVATEERAQSLADEVPGRSYRSIHVEEMPAHARANLETANDDRS